MKPVVIVGAGPTGLTAATFLAQYGVECVVLDRWEAVYPLPRAVHLDDEVYRILARMGVRDEFAAISRPMLGLRLVDRERRVLAEFRRGAEPGRHGFPEANMFDQPELEAILRGNLDRFASATLRGRTEVIGMSQYDDEVVLDVVDRLSGYRETIRASYVLGCDGANSTIRSAIGSSMRDLGFEQRWLVVDVDTEAEVSRWEGVQQICDRHRAASYMRVGATRYRWEFQLTAGETIDDFRGTDNEGFVPTARLQALLAPWTAGEQLQIVRVADYTFRAQLADRWRDRRVFLLGDAAHLTPPFIGQGMGAGIRDAANLAWKLAAVLAGDLPESVLTSYEAERRPHARALVRLARLTGLAMTGGGAAGEFVRRTVVPRVHRLPGLQARVLTSETPALNCSELVHRKAFRRLAGRMCPNALLNDGQRLDEVAAGRFALVTRRAPSDKVRAALNNRDVVLIVVRPGDELHRWLRRWRAYAALVRPDGTVLRAGRGIGAVIESIN
jgi:3-(3-hydroxy-phenyl)propionate hydroxylase